MEAEQHDDAAGAEDEDTWVSDGSIESDAIAEKTGDCLVPSFGPLPCAVYRFHQWTNACWVASVDETCWLPHINFMFHHPVEICCNKIDLAGVQLVLGGQRQDHQNACERRRESFVIIKSRSL